MPFKNLLDPLAADTGDSQPVICERLRLSLVMDNGVLQVAAYPRKQIEPFLFEKQNT